MFSRRAGVVRFLVVWVALLALFAAASWWCLYYKLEGGHPVLDFFPVDDAYIHLAYARSLIEEYGFCYNRGIPEAGMTSPLWVLLLAGMLWLGKHLAFGYVASAKILSALFGLVAVLFSGLLARGKEAGNRGLLLFFLAAGLVLLDPSMNFSRLAGMEVTLAAFLIIGSMYFWSRGRLWLAGVWLGLSCLARPENALLALMLLVGWGIGLAKKRRRLWTLWPLVLPSVLFAALWLFYDWRVTGKLLPNTYYAKSLPLAYYSLGDFFALVHNCVFKMSEFRFGLGAFLYLAGALIIVRRRRDLWPALVYPWLFMLGLSATREFLFYEGYYFNRYFQPVIPGLLIPMAVGLAGGFQLCAWLWKRGRAGTSLAGWAVVAAVAIGLLFLLGTGLKQQRRILALDCAGIGKIHVAAGKWINQNLPPEAVVATYDAGAVGFFGGRKIIDLNGLNTHEMIGNPYFLREARPDYYFFRLGAYEAARFQAGNWYPYNIIADILVYMQPLQFFSAPKYGLTSVSPYIAVISKASYAAPKP